MFVPNNSVIRKLKTDLEKSVLEISKDLVEKSQEEVPVDTGNLRDSVIIENKSKNNIAETMIIYDSEYAIYVHEDLSKRHTNGKVKFLEDPLLEKVKQYIKKIGKVFGG